MAQLPRHCLVMFVIDDGTLLPSVPLIDDVILVGRGAGCQVVLGDPAVSRKHLRLVRDANGWHVSRLPNAGPLLINGTPCEDADLHLGDQLVIGNTVLRFCSAKHDATNNLTVPRTPTNLEQIAAPHLTVRWSGGSFVAPLRDERITLGRDPHCTIIIPAALVSAHHAVLQRSSDGRYTIRDEGSVNGLSAHDQPIISQVLADGDEIVIGTPTDAQQVTLSYTGNQQHHDQHEVLATIGRDPASTYHLPNPLISWQHAQLVRSPNGEIVLVDMGSTNGTYVNHERLHTPQVLTAGDQVHFGAFEFLFDGTQLVAVKASTDGICLSAHGLVRTVNSGKTRLLDDVALCVQPGEFFAIAGGSGAGKTTLMRALAGIQPAQEGQVFFNDVDLYHHYDLFRGSIGYVPQTDIVHGALTVERALYYAARLRLASDLRESEIAERITAVLASVNLTHRRQIVVKSLSGGERKRVNIAVELLADPPIIFLDEPSAALDPNLRQELTETMRALADKGRTVVLVTHHIEDIQICDLLAFMGFGGRLCYFGPPDAAIRHFHVDTIEQMYTVTSEPEAAEQWRAAYQQSPMHQRYVQERLTKLLRDADAEATAPRWQPGKRLSAWQQLTLLMRRYVEIIANDRANLIILLLQAPLIGLIFALVVETGIFADVNKADPGKAQFILFFLAVISIWFGANNAAREICKESDVYERERLAGLGIVPYILSKVSILAAFCAVQTLILFVCVALKTGLSPANAGTHFPTAVEVYISLLLVGLAGMTLGLCVSAFSSTPDKATSLIPLVLIPQIILAGVVFTIASGSIMAVASDLTISRWGVQAMGSTTNLKHIYQHHFISNSNPTLKICNNPTFSKSFGGDFDSTTSYDNYPDNWNDWGAGRASRQVHVNQCWSAIALLSVTFLVATGMRLRAKDPA